MAKLLAEFVKATTTGNAKQSPKGGQGPALVAYTTTSNERPGVYLAAPDIQGAYGTKVFCRLGSPEEPATVGALKLRILAKELTERARACAALATELETDQGAK